MSFKISSCNNQVINIVIYIIKHFNIKPKIMLKKYSYLLLWSLLFCSTLSNAQVNQFEWGLPAGDSHWSGGIKLMTADAAGNVFITSPHFTFGNLSIGDTSLAFAFGDMFTAKIDKTGHTEWVRPSAGIAGGTGPNPFSIITDTKGDCYIIGTVNDPATFHGVSIGSQAGEVFVIKIRTNGDLDWGISMPVNSQFLQDGLNSIDVHNGSLRVGGVGSNFYTKIDTIDGTIQYQAPTSSILGGNRIVTDNQGNNYFLDTDVPITPFSIGGLTYTPTGPYTSILLKQDSVGNSIWIKEFSSNFHLLNDIEIDKNGDIYILGSVRDSLQLDGNTFVKNPNPQTTNTSFLNFVAKFDSSMNLIWTQAVGAFDFNILFSDTAYMELELDLVGNVYSATSCGDGYFVGNYPIAVPYSSGTSLVTKLNSKGSIIWVKQVEGYGNAPKALAVSPEGVYLYGNCSSGITYFNNYPLGLNGSFITKLTNEGTNQVSGLVFIDDNENGIRDNNEISTDDLLVKYNNNYYITTDTSGSFSSFLANGTYSVGAVLPRYWEQTKPDTTIIFANGFESVDSLELGVKPIGNVQDLEVYISSTAIRPGFDMRYSVTYRNVGTIPMSGTLELTLDDTLSYLSSNPMGSYTNSKVTWNYNNLQVGEVRTAIVDCNMPVALGLLGTDLIANIVIEPVATDTTPANNVLDYAQLITGSYDPNDKQVSPSGAVDTNFINDGAFLYTIRFQNTGNDTAFTVRVADTLDNHLDISTLQMINASHNYTFDLENKAIMWTFNNILLPDSTTNEPESHGFILYSIRPKQATLLNDTIANTAHIYFDFNPPIITNTTISAVEILTQTHQVTPQQLEKINVFPNPTNGWLTCEMENFQANETYFFRLFDIQGRLMAEYPITENRQTIDLNDFPIGMYVFQLMSAESGLKGTGKVLTQ
jgi:uncharacterized repeat protein (TIGR01451 family)